PNVYHTKEDIDKLASIPFMRAWFHAGEEMKTRPILTKPVKTSRVFRTGDPTFLSFDEYVGIF
ncbi:hypothetical protein BM530_21190, partial [Clostridioides difficile]